MTKLPSGENVRAQSRLLTAVSPAMKGVLRQIERVAPFNHTVLITGETGTGKELVAQAIHGISRRAERDFVAVDCASLPPMLVESELFGHEKGAFTGAFSAKAGLIRAADQGTLFLDEIGELSLGLQAKLLRVLQERVVRPVGATHGVPVNIRILAATNRELAGEVRSKRFREDLFFRLNVIEIHMPPLRQRREDIPQLADVFLDDLNAESGAKLRISPHAMSALVRHHWPGNVRELENAILRAAAHADGEVLQLKDFPFEVQNPLPPPLRSDLPSSLPLAEIERLAIARAVHQCRGDKLAAARLLGIGKTTLYRKLREYHCT